MTPRQQTAFLVLLTIATIVVAYKTGYDHGFTTAVEGA